MPSIYNIIPRKEYRTMFFIISAFVFGLLSIALSYIAAYLGPRIIQIPIAIWGMVGGPLIGVFIMGMFFPCCNSWASTAVFHLGSK